MQRSPISAISSMRCEMKTTAAPGRDPLAHEREEPVARRDVQRRGGLVEDQDLRVAHQRAGQAAGLALAQRQLLDGHVERRRRAQQRVQDLLRARCASRAGGHACARTRPSVPIQTLSSTDRGSTTSTSWNTVAMPAAADAPRRRDALEPASPPSSIDPASGGGRRRGSSPASTCPSRSRRRCSAPRRRAARTSSRAAPGWRRTPWPAPSCAGQRRRTCRRGRRGSGDRVWWSRYSAGTACLSS